MSDVKLPDLKGLTYSITKTPIFKTIVQESVSGLEKRIGLTAYPRWRFKLQYSVLVDDGTTSGDFQQLAGFFLARKGSLDDFLLYDETDNLPVASGLVSVGDSLTKDFQLLVPFGGSYYPIYGVSGSVTAGTVVVKVNGATAPVETTTCSTRAVVTFTTAPASGAMITASFNPLWRVRFSKSETDFDQFCHDLYEAKAIELVSLRE